MRDLLGVFGRPVRNLATMTLACGAVVGSAVAMNAQSAPAAAPPVIQTQPEVLNFEALAQQGKELVEKAKAGSGSAGITLAEYNGHHTMLTARVKSGGAEQHTHFADFLIVVDGEGTELTGGTIVDRKDGPNGEIHGTKLEGATAHVLHKGDVIHIPAGTPHQAIEAPGQSITIYVIKVEEPGPSSPVKLELVPPPPPPPPPPSAKK